MYNSREKPPAPSAAPFMAMGQQVSFSAGQKYDTPKYILNIFKYIQIRYGPGTFT
jgi:hypothetical protein